MVARTSELKVTVTFDTVSRRILDRIAAALEQQNRRRTRTLTYPPATKTPENQEETDK